MQKSSLTPMALWRYLCFCRVAEDLTCGVPAGLR